MKHLRHTRTKVSACTVPHQCHLLRVDTKFIRPLHKVLNRVKNLLLCIGKWLFVRFCIVNTDYDCV